MLLKIIIFFILIISSLEAKIIENCKWDNREGNPCITVTKTPNTSVYSSDGVSKQIITKQDIINSGALDVNDVLNMVPGLDLKQNGQRGQLTSLFMRGTNSNHTLVLLNGIAINDQSTTQGLHNFGQDFVQTIQQVEIYKGANGAHFGPSAIGGAINFVTDIDYQNNFSISGFDEDNKSFDGNYTIITSNDWHINFKGSETQSKTGSARHGGKEDDGTKNTQLNLNIVKWIKDDLKFRSILYSRETKSDYDGSASAESGYVADDNMYAFQTGFDRISKNSEDSLTFHYNNYDRTYENGGYYDEYYSESVVARGERKIATTRKFSFGFGSEYKYDWAHFTDDGSWSQPSTKGFVHNLAVFGNTGIKFSENTILSLYGRVDDHKTTDVNSTYKINLKKLINKFEFGLTHSTGLRNPSLYELYGNNGRTDAYKHVANPNAKPEKSNTNEFFTRYNFSDNIFIQTTAYRSSIKDALLYDSSFNGGSGYTNTAQDLKQDGLETAFALKGEDQTIYLFNTISSSKKKDGSHQLNRPDLTYGANYTKKFVTDLIGPFNLNFNYKHYGKVFDFDPGETKVDSTDLMNLSLSKEINNSLWSINITNLLDEGYVRPVGYNQDKRQIRVNYRIVY